MFRTGFLSVLQKSQAAGAVDAPAFSRINQSLHHHHQAEDSMWFPGFRRQHPELKACIDALEAEHAQLVRLEARVMKGDMQVRQPQRLHSSAIFLRFDAHAGVAAVLRRIVRPSEPRGNDECAVFYGRYSGVLRCVQPARARLYSARMCCRAAALRPSLFYCGEQAACATFHLPVCVLYKSSIASVLYKSSIASAARCIGAFTNEFRSVIVCFCVEFQLSHLQRNTFWLQRIIFIIDEQSRGSVIRSSTQKFDSICL